MVRSISIIVEAALGLIAVLTAFLWYLSHRRPSNLASDPASIADVMSLVNTDRGSLGDLKDDGSLAAPVLARALSCRTFQLKTDSISGYQTLHMTSQSPPEVNSHPDSTKSSRSSPSIEGFKPVRPKEPRLFVGATLVSVLLAALTVIVFLDIWSLKNNGISLPSNNPIVLSIIENYLPTTFATFLEPAWVILNRLLCLLQPFDELRKGNAKPSSSVEVKYSSLPSQLVIWRAIKSHHFLLAAVCAIAVSTNILTVAALISEGSTTAIFPMTGTQDLAPQFNGTALRSDGTSGPNSPPITYFDHFYVEVSNLTDGTSLPPWTDSRLFYLPFNTGNPPAFSTSGTSLTFQGVEGTTIGFGAQSTCINLSLDQSSNNSVTFKPDSSGSQIQFTTSHVSSNGTIVSCVGSAISNAFNETIVSTNNFTAGPSALEAISTMAAVNGTDDGGFCTSLIVIGWVRVNTLQDGDFASAFIGCTAKLTAAQFDVLVDLDGHVLQSRQSSEYLSNSTQFFSGKMSEMELFQQANRLMTPPTLVNGWQWHNDSFTSDWLNSLLGYALESDILVNHSAPPPDPAKAINLMQSMYQKLFAILLGLNTHVFADSSRSTELSTTAVMIESRRFISQLMFDLAVVIIGLQLIVAVLYYTYRPKRFLPRMPTSIASIIAFVGASRALDDFYPFTEEEGNEEEHRYGYGRFIGTDGKTHVGIERQRFVVPLKSRNPEVKRRKWGWRKGNDGRTPKTWI